MAEPLFTRRTYLVCKAMQLCEVDVFTAMESVSSVAIEFPEWKMNERRTWAEWEREDNDRKGRGKINTQQARDRGLDR